VSSVTYGPHDRIAAASYDGDARIFRCDLCVSFDRLVAIAAQRAAGALTSVEKVQYLGED
jgi:hypothetical protein